MRKLILALGAAALLTAPAALAKERNSVMIVPTARPRRARPWMATIAVKMDGHYTPGQGAGRPADQRLRGKVCDDRVARRPRKPGSTGLG